MFILQTSYHSTPQFQSICAPSWVNVYSRHYITSTSSFWSPYTPIFGKCLFATHYITSTLHLYLHAPSPGCIYSTDITSPLPSIPISMYPLLGKCSTDITSHLPSISISMYPLLGKCLFYRHYITSNPPFLSPCTPSYVSVILLTLHHLYPSNPIFMYLLICKSLLSRHKTSLLPLHYYLHVSPYR